MGFTTGRGISSAEAKHNKYLAEADHLTPKIDFILAHLLLLSISFKVLLWPTFRRILWPTLQEYLDDANTEKKRRIF